MATSTTEPNQTLLEQYDHYRVNLLAFACFLVGNPDKQGQSTSIERMREFMLDGEQLLADMYEASVGHGKPATDEFWAEFGRLTAIVQRLTKRDISAFYEILAARNHMVEGRWFNIDPNPVI